MKYKISPKIAPQDLLPQKEYEATKYYLQGCFSPSSNAVNPSCIYSIISPDFRRGKIRALLEKISGVSVIKTKEELSHFINVLNTPWNVDTYYLKHPHIDNALIPVERYKEFIIRELASEILAYIAQNMSLAEITIDFERINDIQGEVSISAPDVGANLNYTNKQAYSLSAKDSKHIDEFRKIRTNVWLPEFPDITKAIQCKFCELDTVSEISFSFSLGLNAKVAKSLGSYEDSYRFHVKYIKANEQIDTTSESISESSKTNPMRLGDITNYSIIELNIPAIVAGFTNVYVFSNASPESKIIGELKPNTRITIQYVPDNYLSDEDYTDMVRIITNDLDGYVASSSLYVSLTEKKYTQEQWLILGMILFHQYDEDYDLIPKPRMAKWESTDETIAEHYLRVEPKELSFSDIQNAFYDEYSLNYFSSCFDSSSEQPDYVEKDNSLGVITGIGGPGRNFKLDSIVAQNENEIIFSLSVKYPWDEALSCRVASICYEDGKWKCGIFI